MEYKILLDCWLKRCDASQVSYAMRRMHERQNIGKVILIPEAKKAKEKPTGSDGDAAAAAAAADSAGTSSTDDTKKEEAAVDDKTEKD